MNNLAVLKWAWLAFVAIVGAVVGCSIFLHERCKEPDLSTSYLAMDGTPVPMTGSEDRITAPCSTIRLVQYGITYVVQGDHATCTIDRKSN